MKKIDVRNYNDYYTDENGVSWGPWFSIRDYIPHRYSIPTTKVSFDLFNEYCESITLRNSINPLKYKQFILDKNDNISSKTPWGTNYYKMNIAHNSTYAELFINDERGCALIIFRNNELTAKSGPAIVKGFGGAQSLRVLRKELWKDGVDLNKYALSEKEGQELHERDKIENPRLIKVLEEDCVNKKLHNCHHLDLNSAYPAGLAHYFPEMKPTLTRLYESRHTNPENKATLNMSVGMMESSLKKYKYNGLAYKAHKFTNDKIYEMTNYLRSTGRKPLLYNTDGIWYQGELLDINDHDLGGWKTDHKNCILRIKSRGAYEFIEEGKYTPVLRGYTTLDRIKPREDWVWGDIYQEEAEELQLIEVQDDIDFFIGLERIETKEGIHEEQ